MLVLPFSLSFSHLQRPSSNDFSCLLVPLLQFPRFQRFFFLCILWRTVTSCKERFGRPSSHRHVVKYDTLVGTESSKLLVGSTRLLLVLLLLPPTLSFLKIIRILLHFLSSSCCCSSPQGCQYFRISRKINIASSLPLRRKLQCCFFEIWTTLFLDELRRGNAF